MKKKILVGIIIVLVLACCTIVGIYVYDNYGNDKKNNDDSNRCVKDKDNSKDIFYYANDKNVVVELDDSQKLFNNKYLVEYTKNEDNDNYIYSVKDLSNKVLYESKDGFNIHNNLRVYDSLFEDKDGNLYFVDAFLENDEPNYFKLYKLVDKKLKLVYEANLEEDYNYFNPIVKYIGGYGLNYIVMGFVINDDYIIDLDGNKYDYDMHSASQRLSSDSEYFNTNTRYVPVILKVLDDKTFPAKLEVGLLDIKEKKLIDGIVYEDIITTPKDVFLVEKDGKYGIVDTNNDILVPIEYDFIEYYNDFYFLIQGDKNILLDENYKTIGEFTTKISYIVRPCCLDESTYRANKFGDNYLVYTYDIEYANGRDRTNRKYHLLSPNGEYKTLENIFNDSSDYKIYGDKLVVLYNKGFKVYDTNFNLISSHEEDSMIYPSYFVNNIFVYSLEDDEIMYYNIETDSLMDSDEGFDLVEIGNIKIRVEKDAFKIFDKDKLLLQTSGFFTYDSDISNIYNSENGKYTFIINK